MAQRRPSSGDDAGGIASVDDVVPARRARRSRGAWPVWARTARALCCSDAYPASSATVVSGASPSTIPASASSSRTSACSAVIEVPAAASPRCSERALDDNLRATVARSARGDTRKTARTRSASASSCAASASAAVIAATPGAICPPRSARGRGDRVRRTERQDGPMVE